MLKLPSLHKLVLLLALLSGCSSVDSGAGDEPTVLQANQVQLISSDLLVAKGVTTDGRNDSGDPEAFNPFLPDNFSFTLSAQADTRVRHNWFGFRARAGSVNRDRNIRAQWLGPRGLIGYEMLPHGLNFSEPVDMLIDITLLVDSGLWDITQLVIYLDNEDGTYTPLPSTPENEDGEGRERTLLRTELEHFSKYVIGVGPPPGGNGGN
jgi:hypothetical protein